MRSRFKRYRPFLAGAGVLAMCSTLVAAQDAPQSLLPPGFDDPVPAPAPTPTPTPTAVSRPKPAASGNVPAAGTPAAQARAEEGAQIELPPGLPSLEELENIEPEELDELLGLKPKFDIPPAARRSMDRVGLLASGEGGMPPRSLAMQPASLVRAALAGTRGPMVSRWGHILLRRALASRMEAPAGMDPVEFAALRAALLNRIGEHSAARSLVQDVDTGNWNKGLTDAALQAYIGTADIVGACPIVKLEGGQRKDPQWQMLQAICTAYAGQGARAGSALNRALARKIAPDIDVLLAQRYAGAAGYGRRAISLEWDGVEEMTPWRFALATALGADIPEKLLANAGAYYQRISATAPMLALPARAAGADRAASEGILSAAALVDLYSQIYAEGAIEGPRARAAALLRSAYVGEGASGRLAAMKDIWGDKGAADFSNLIMTAYAAARMPVNAEFEEDAGLLIASMLTAGLDRNALRWAEIVTPGSQGWALLSVAGPTPANLSEQANLVASGSFDEFMDNDDSVKQRKSKFLLASLAGLGRMEEAAIADLSGRLSIDLKRKTKWSTLIDQAALVNNQVLVTYLAGVGMQGEGWDKMTPLHLYSIISALKRVGLSAEARMIAAEAVARG